MVMSNTGEYLNDPALWQGIFNRQYGIPTAGRSMYQTWQANQYPRTAAGYELQAQPEFAHLQPVGAEPETYASYLANRPGQSMRQLGPGSRFEAFSGLDPTGQRGILERMQTPGAASLIGTSGMRGKYAPGLVEPIASQAYGRPSALEYQTSPGGISGESFLNYLRSKYGF